MTYIIAEIGNNHDGDFERAKRLTALAAQAGVDAVKFQIFEASKLVHPTLPAMVPTHATQLERMQALQFTDAQWKDLIDLAHASGVDFIATCFDVETLRKWAPYTKYIKIASGDLTYHTLIREAAILGKPILLSTGMATLEEIETAWRLTNNATVLHCVSQYPCATENANLGVIDALKQFYRNVGYSDHVPGITASMVAIAKGIRVLEKHFTDEHRDYGDHLHSANVEEMRYLTEFANHYISMSGSVKPCPAEMSGRDRLRRGAYAKHKIDKHQMIGDKDVIALRPGYGLLPDRPIGWKARRDYEELEAIG